MKQPFYYEIERDGHTLYALGTLHLGVEASELPGFIRDDLKKSKVFVSEVTQEILDLADEVTARRYLGLDFRERIRTQNRLSAKLKSETWLKLKEELAKKMPDQTEVLDFLPPRLALGLMEKGEESGPVIEISRAEYYRIRFSRMDAELYSDAKKYGKTRLSIDRSRQIDSCLDEIYIASIEAAYTTGRGSDAEGTLRLIRAYRDGDEALLLKIHDESRALLSKPVANCMLAERNKSWSELIQRFAPENGPFFIAVGAAHLIGQDSVLSMLEKEGYKVLRVVRRP